MWGRYRGAAWLAAYHADKLPPYVQRRLLGALGTLRRELGHFAEMLSKR